MAVAVLLVVVFATSGWLRRWAEVDESFHVAVRAGALELPVTRFLHRVKGIEVTTSSSTWTLVARRAAWWTLISAIALFPFGLLFLLFKESARLDVLVRPSAEGSEIHLVGTMRRDVLDRVRAAVEGLPRAAAPLHHRTARTE